MKTGYTFKTRIRVMQGPTAAIGPGKAELLTLIAETGSLRQAALGMEMSYMRAWSLVREMNRAFRLPLVESVRGGKQGGGARLTRNGTSVLAIYREMEANAQQAAEKGWMRLRRRLK
jgi:molybdate transport system regulatory protein